MNQATDQGGYYAVIATTTLQPMSPEMQKRYAAMAEHMLKLARHQDGFLGSETG